MRSELRLHPLTIAFAFVTQLRQFALPLIVVLFTSRSGKWGWEAGALVFALLSTLFAVARYLSFRLRYDPSELVIRSGILFRTERHIPYERIQNLDAVQNLAHRMFGVMEIRVQTASGTDPEATLSVVPVHAYDEMRRRVFAERHTEELAADAPTRLDGADMPADALLTLSPRELLIAGFLQARGTALVAAVIGVAFELDLVERALDAIAGSVGASLRLDVGSLAGGPVVRTLIAAALLVALLLLIRLVAALRTAIRLYGFQLARRGDDLKTEYGYFTRVSATVPIRRIQTITVREGPLHLLFGRVSIAVQSVGGVSTDEHLDKKVWIAPAIESRAAPALLASIVPTVDIASADWQSVAPRAFGRMLRVRLAFAVLLALALAIPTPVGAAVALLLLSAVGIVDARQRARRLGWALQEELVLARRGWLWRETTITSMPRIQAVERFETPFDRRTAMASVYVDTAGPLGSTGLRIPYLARDVADRLHQLLASRAGRVAMDW